ncbi:response regulator [Alloacidobacterium dinghuense]|uniref:Response regulator n=1 Tax=Alloacidobacterium dinghuense TaxID=2763107 RepID=A0A7G8BKX1_9BACT|nr:response regulator [Alloacidobacterium dinghuense]QNI33191.1 response regulator [Alloacidobacterium dinghuense]
MEVRPGGCRFVILCVDDEPIALLIRQRVLEKAGYEVIPASSVNQALEILDTRLIDLVLTDFLMPGKTGAELAGEVKRRKPDIPVVMISGVHEIPDGLAADLFLNKLEGPVYLCERIREVLQEI